MIPHDLQPLVHDHRRPGGPRGGAEGVIVAEADIMGGFSLYVQDGKLAYTYSFLGVKVDRQESTRSCPPARCPCGTQFIADEPASRPRAAGRLLVNGKVGEGRLERTVPVRFTTYAGMDIGRDNGEPVPPLRRQIAVRLHRQDREGRFRPRAAPEGGTPQGGARSSPPHGCRARDQRMKGCGPGPGLQLAKPAVTASVGLAALGPRPGCPVRRPT